MQFLNSSVPKHLTRRKGHRSWVRGIRARSRASNSSLILRSPEVDIFRPSCIIAVLRRASATNVALRDQHDITGPHTVTLLVIPGTQVLGSGSGAGTPAAASAESATNTQKILEDIKVEVDFTLEVPGITSLVGVDLTALATLCRRTVD